MNQLFWLQNKGNVVIGRHQENIMERTWVWAQNRKDLRWDGYLRMFSYLKIPVFSEIRSVRMTKNQPIQSWFCLSSCLTGGESWMTEIYDLRVHDLWLNSAEVQCAAPWTSALVSPAYTNILCKQHCLQLQLICQQHKYPSIKHCGLQAIHTNVAWKGKNIFQLTFKAYHPTKCCVCYSLYTTKYTKYTTKTIFWEI